MAVDDAAAVSTLLKGVFEPHRWVAYARRAKILSSPDSCDWDSMDFPVEIALELTNHCNLKCIMCPVPSLKRERGFMSEPLFEKTVADISGEAGYLFLPQGFGEPLLHARWSRLMKFARSVQIGPIIVLTNGMLLRADLLPSFMDMVDVIVVTIDGSTAETYESVRVKSNFGTVTNNVENFLKMRSHSLTPHLIVRMIRMRDTEMEVEAFRTQWSRKIGRGDLVQISDCIDWAGSVPYRNIPENQVQTSRHPCRMLWKNLTVYHDGRVSPCCYDAEGELLVGNVVDQSLRDIWNGARLRDLRSLHRSHGFEKIAICSRCRNWQ
ncbi:MAG TPA: radical SAM/SPASM domain-containing protein [Thermodesulfovibrionales bacterium]|nr:radical SAM/SPASM domain-containing protein [Thermodesulfovibrionales bacterium]